MTPARARAFDFFADGLTHSKSQAAHEANVSAGVIDGLIDEGTLETVLLPPASVGSSETWNQVWTAFAFTSAKSAAARSAAICAATVNGV